MKRERERKGGKEKGVKKEKQRKGEKAHCLPLGSPDNSQALQLILFCNYHHQTARNSIIVTHFSAKVTVPIQINFSHVSSSTFNGLLNSKNYILHVQSFITSQSCILYEAIIFNKVYCLEDGVSYYSYEFYSPPKNKLKFYDSIVF